MSGDLPEAELRAALHRVADMVADYVTGVGEYPVLPPVVPGEVANQLPPAPPVEGEAIDRILDDYKSIIEPNVTHWNHPGFLAYFGITGSGPGILGEVLAAGLNVNAMLWRTSPAATELEERVCDWLRQMVGLPEPFSGHINDTASISTLLALAAARHSLGGPSLRDSGLIGASAPLCIYASDQAHSSVDKSAITLGIGLDNLRRIPSDGEFRLNVDQLKAAIAEDRAAGKTPIAVVATAGTTSTTSVDPIQELAEICREEGIWLHVDAAYAGSAAICPEMREQFRGWERADSIVMNPHKWLFTPIDCSVLFVRDPELLRETFSVVPEYLRSADQDVTNLMDLGVQLGRRFRALKLWMVVRSFGVRGLQERIRNHCEMARELAGWIEKHSGFELVAPVPFSVVCFRAVVVGDAEEQDRLNQRILNEVNAAGPVFLSHTVLDGRYTLRIAVGNLKTTLDNLATAWRLLQEAR